MQIIMSYVIKLLCNYGCRKLMEMWVTKKQKKNSWRIHSLLLGKIPSVVFQHQIQALCSHRNWFCGYATRPWLAGCLWNVFTVLVPTVASCSHGKTGLWYTQRQPTWRLSRMVFVFWIRWRCAHFSNWITWNVHWSMRHNPFLVRGVQRGAG